MNQTLQLQEEFIPKAEMQGEQENQGMENERKFTQDEVNKIISERLLAERKKSQMALETTIETVKTTAESSTKEALFKEVESRETAVAQRELVAYAKERLNDLALPASLIGLVETVSNVNIDRSIEGLEKIFREAVKESVGQRLAAKSPVAWEQNHFDERIKRAMGL